MTFESLARSASADGSVSVVVPTYYRNERLRTAVESARAQEPSPHEVIVVDGSGEAHAEPVARETGVTYVAQDEDRGAQAARSRGAALASGEYVQFLDDDRLLPGKFRAQLPLFDDDVGVVYAGVRDEEWGDVRPDEAVRGHVLERALWGTYHRAGKKHLEERPWSLGAIRSFARAAAHEPDEPARELGVCLASLFGRPGVRVAEAVLP